MLNQYSKMKFIAAIIYIIIQVIFIPLALIGFVLVSFKQLVISRKLGVSGTALSAMGGRWIMNAYGMRKDDNTERLYRALPNGSEFGLWLLLFPAYLRHKISPLLPKSGHETVFDVVATRTFHFDRLINKSLAQTGQFVIMGAGYDTRAYGFIPNKNIKFFELDQLNTQQLKIASLHKAGINHDHVTFVDVDFTTEKWYDKLERAGYDPGKKSIFLWEGVTLYLSEDDVRNTIREIKAHTAPGSVLLVDFYAKKLLALKGIKRTREHFNFGLDFSANYEGVLKDFLETVPVNLGEFYFMGHKHKKGPLGVVTELCIQ